MKEVFPDGAGIVAKHGYLWAYMREGNVSTSLLRWSGERGEYYVNILCKYNTKSLYV